VPPQVLRLEVGVVERLLPDQRRVLWESRLTRRRVQGRQGRQGSPGRGRAAASTV